MNRGYAYVNGKVVVSNLIGNMRLGENYANLNDVLAQENLVETVKDKILELEKKSESYKKSNKGRYIPIFLIISAIMTTIVVPLIQWWLEGSNPFMITVNSIFGATNRAVISMLAYSIILLPMAAYFELSTYIKRKKAKREEKGVNSELEFLKEQLVVEEQKLEELKKEKKREEEDKEFRSLEVDDSSRLDGLKELLEFYYDLGYNIEKYFRCYQQGNLSDELRKNYSNEQIEIAKKYLEEKGHTLVKRK